MAHQQYLFKQLHNLIGVLADELGQGGEMRDGIARQRFKDDVGLAAPLDLAAGDDAFGVSANKSAPTPQSFNCTH